MFSRLYSALALALLLLSLAGCVTLLPEPNPAPQPLLLNPLTQVANPVVSAATRLPSYPLRLLVERPLASSPWRQEALYYRDEGFALQAFSRHVWAESLDQQLQYRLSEWLAAQPWVAAVSLDTAGFRTAYRLRLQINHWYLDTASEQLHLSLQLNLLTADGQSLWQQQWQETQPVTSLSPQGLVAASQHWLNRWTLALERALKPWSETPPP